VAPSRRDGGAEFNVDESWLYFPSTKLALLKPLSSCCAGYAVIALSGSSACFSCDLGGATGGLVFGGYVLVLVMIFLYFGAVFVWLFFISNGRDVQKSCTLGNLWIS